MSKKKLHHIHEVIQELDAWMIHYTDWSVSEDPVLSMRHYESARILEQARNLLADRWGEDESPRHADFGISRV